MTRPPARLAMISSSWPWAKPEADRKAVKSTKRMRRHQRGEGPRRVERIGKRLNIIFLEVPRPPPSSLWRAWRPRRCDRDSFRCGSRPESYEYLRYFPADLPRGEPGPRFFPFRASHNPFRDRGIGRRRAWRPEWLPAE